MTIWNHIKSQPFVAATAAAALIHSAWSLGTLFSGTQPVPPIIGDDMQLWIEFVIKTLAWHIPAVSIAFAFDVGQVVTAHEIRTAHSAGRIPIRKYVTFVVFAAATYYLQMLYAAHHFPDLALGAGVSPEHRPTVQLWLDAAVWVIPAFLPLSTLLYTFSGGDTDNHVETPQNAPIKPETPSIRVDTPQRPITPVLEALPPHIEQLVNELATAPMLPEFVASVAPALDVLPPYIEQLVNELATAPMLPELTTVNDAPESLPLLPDEALIELDTVPLPFDEVLGVKAKAKPSKPAPAPAAPQPSLF